MNRVIKFRAWFPGYGLMGNVVTLKGSNEEFKFHTVVAECYRNGRQEFYEAYTFELMQFTGLKDKNGVEIYEGDIVRFIDTEVSSSECGTDYDDLPMIEPIVWNYEECGWDVSSRNYIDREDFLAQAGDDVEVIGNIYEYPHLLTPIDTK